MSCNVTLNAHRKKILNFLLDKYENSAVFKDFESSSRRISFKPEKLFPKYADEKEYDLFTELNRDIRELSAAGLVEISELNMRITKVVLVTGVVDEIYDLLGRQKKRDVLNSVRGLLAEELAFIEGGEAAGGDVAFALKRYILAQMERIKDGKLPEYYEDAGTAGKNGEEDYGDLWKAFRYLMQSDEDVYIRDLSVRLYNDSKRLESLRARIQGCLFKYGDFPEKEVILDELGVVKTPTYVSVKGPLVLNFEGQSLDLGRLNGDIALSSNTLKDILGMEIYGKRVITVENLTSFHGGMFEKDDILIYLGGFHNRVKREFLRMMYDAGKNVRYYHFGDIDAGGFYIYEHLRRLTGIPFMTYKMDRETLDKYEDYTKKLTANDAVRLNVLAAKYENGEIKNDESAVIAGTLRYMLQKNIKLEQEAIGD